MVTCYLRYVIDPFKLKEFEHYGKIWIPLVEKFGGNHHGYFMPSEGANNIALALFTFPSFALYEEYRKASMQDPNAFLHLNMRKIRVASSAMSGVFSARFLNNDNHHYRF